MISMEDLSGEEWVGNLICIWSVMSSICVTKKKIRIKYSSLLLMNIKSTYLNLNQGQLYTLKFTR